MNGVRHGEHHPQTSLREADVLEIRRVIQRRRAIAREIAEVSIASLARKFRVRLETVTRVRSLNRRGTHGNSVLSPEDCRLVSACIAERDRLRAEAKPLSDRALAERFGVSVQTVRRIADGETWIHLWGQKAS